MRRAVLALVALIAVGCTDDGIVGEGTQIGQEASCFHTPVSQHTVDDAANPLGLSAADFIDANNTYQATLAWADGPTTGVQVDLAYDGELSEASDDVVYEEGDSDSCPARLRIQARVDITTDDGALAETFQGELRVYDGATAWFDGDRYGDTLQGDVDLARFAEISGLSNTIVYLHLAWGQGAEGVIEINPQNESGSGDGSPLRDVASW